jgi:hypothetical protein
MALSDFTAAVWTSTTFGDGSYVLRGNELTLVPDKGKPEGYLVRMEQITEDGKNWSEKLYMMQRMERCNVTSCPQQDTEIGLTRRNP